MKNLQSFTFIVLVELLRTLIVQMELLTLLPFVLGAPSTFIVPNESLLTITMEADLETFDDVIDLEADVPQGQTVAALTTPSER